VVVTVGAIEANFLALSALCEPGDRVVVAVPAYQQLYEVPRALGAQVELVRLRPENAYLPDLAVLRRQMAGRVKLLVLNNPNNPTGALMPRAMLEEIVAMARAAGAYILCDEVHRDLLQPGVEPAPSIVDLYERGVATASMSKVFSLAGLRLGWVASRDGALMTAVLSRRDYTTISCGMIDDHLAAFALGHRDAVLRRSLAIVRENLALLDAWVEAEPAVSYVRPRAGTTALLAFDAHHAAHAPPGADHGEAERDGEPVQRAA
ncbi:MAG: aminotransferase class I/II-fold pyridoxal phosphate-dependent enzyme, partial [Pseudomonadota bacterium]|jgi:aspartate/methionine/tyrosine aminotransferase|nr:aminotransferase class I/II-fold pyridoxal phosphate-dependent enzyme [Pseudomonadota bacterium]